MPFFKVFVQKLFLWGGEGGCTPHTKKISLHFIYFVNRDHLVAKEDVNLINKYITPKNSDTAMLLGDSNCWIFSIASYIFITLSSIIPQLWGNAWSYLFMF